MSDEQARNEPEFFEGPGLDADLGNMPKWPKVVGIISIVFGAIGLCCVGCGGILRAMPVFFAQQMAQQFPDGIPPALTNPPPTVWLDMIFGLVVVVVLLISGVVLVLRNPAGRMLHLVYGVLGVISGTWGLYSGYQHQLEIAKWIHDNPDTKFAQAQQGPGADIGFYIGMGLGILFAYSWPGFCLIWFGLVKKTRESITGTYQPAA
ncbi:MAG TPA: hypothetical protein VG797_00600 [Phycisphaerales bacterium]|nr:hypothetical protein [Phycisphaerales bacterium]